MEVPVETEGTTTQDVFSVVNSTTTDDSLLLPNASEPEGPSLYLNTSWTAYFLFSLACLFLAVGLFGNIFTLIVTIKSKGSSKSHNILIISLAVMDTLALVTSAINQPSFTEVMRLYIGAMSGVFCRVFMAIYKIVSFNATLVIVLISIERFIVVWFPLKSQQLLTTKKIIISIVICSLVSFLLQIFPAVFSNTEALKCVAQVNLAANVDEKQPLVLGIPSYLFIRVILAALPGIILLIFTPLTIGKLLHRHVIRRHLTVQESNTGTFRISVLLMTVVVMFLLLYIAPNIIMVALFAGRITVHKGSLLECVFILSHVNHSTNFILYAVFLKEFRGKLIAFLSCACIKHIHETTVASNTSSTRPTDQNK